MKQNFINQINIEGYVYQHSLEVKTVKDSQSANFGKEFLNGNLDIAVDEEGLNVVTVHYTYVTPTTKQDKPNRTYEVLKSIIDSGKTWLNVGKEGALKVKCQPSFALNDFYSREGQLVSQMTQEGGFISIIQQFSDKRNRFDLDLLISSVTHVEADEEKNIKEDYCTIRGAAFDFKKAILPMTFKLSDPKGMDWFEGLDASSTNPVFLKVWGEVNSISTKVVKREESAFGEDSVTTYDKKVKEWLITGASPVPYDFGDETVLTAAEVQKALQDREVLLADVKRRSEEYKASKAAAPSVAPAPAKSNMPALIF
jgi:hypothetical protein